METSTNATSSPEAMGKADMSPLTAEQIQAWLIAYLSKLLEIAPDEISVSISFDRYGLDSSATIGLTSDLGDFLGREIDPAITYSFPTIEALTKNLVESA